MSERKTSLRRIDVPPIDLGAPMPLVVADEDNLLFGYHVRTGVGTPSPPTWAIVSVDRYLNLRFGYPNDEVIEGHRYGTVGLASYCAHEVIGSEWIGEMMLANRVHRGHSDSMFEAYRHFIFTFHDSTLEFVARDEPRILLESGELRDLILGKAGRTSSAGST